MSLQKDAANNAAPLSLAMAPRTSGPSPRIRSRAIKFTISNYKGNCWDNAPTERFSRSLKTERLDGLRFSTRESARLEVIDYITYYNALRLHSTLGYISPMGYEKEQLRKAA